MSSVVISGNTSGTVTLFAPDVSGTTVLTLPTSNGTVLTQNSSAPANSFVVDASGNVGIGTNSPSSYYATKLVVAGGDEQGITIANTNGGSANGSLLTFANGTSGTSPYNGYIKYNHLTNYMAFATNAGTERMRITSNGGVAFGGASNFGTSGQVLQSNGDAAPTWVTPASGGVTSLNGQTGAITDTNLYAIGSYITGRPQNSTNYNVNTTIAGSSLYSTGPSSSYSTSTGAWTPASSATLINTGTWRCVSPAYGASSSDIRPGLWVRIS